MGCLIYGQTNRQTGTESNREWRKGTYELGGGHGSGCGGSGGVVVDRMIGR